MNKFEKGSPEWRMFAEYYQLCKKYWNVLNTDEYWEKYVQESNDLYKKYASSAPFVRKLIQSLTRELEEMMRNDKCRENQTYD